MFDNNCLKYLNPTYAQRIFIFNIWKCVLTDNLRTANKYESIRVSVDRQYIMCNLCHAPLI